MSANNKPIFVSKYINPGHIFYKNHYQLKKTSQVISETRGNIFSLKLSLWIARHLGLKYEKITGSGEQHEVPLREAVGNLPSFTKYSV